MKQVSAAVLVSGGGTNLQAIINAVKSKTITSAKIAVVASNNPNAYALTRAKQAGIPAVCIDKKGRGLTQEQFEKELQAVLDEYGVQLVVLAGFLCVLTADFCEKYQKRIINVHPSLIPKYCGGGFYGLKVHRAVLAAGEKVTGATVHYVTAVVDGGDIIAQKQVPVLPDDDENTLQRRVMEQAEWVILPQAVESVSQQILKEQG